VPIFTKIDTSADFKRLINAYHFVGCIYVTEGVYSSARYGFL